MKKNKQQILQARLSPLVISLALAFSGSTRAGVHFDPSMISDGADSVADLAQLVSSGDQLPGAYPVDIYVNGDSVGSRSLTFVSVSEGDKTSHDNTGLLACLTTKDLAEWGVNVTAFSELAALATEPCVAPGKYIPQAWTAFDFQALRLDISIPQEAMQNRPHGWIPPEQWDEGITAALMSWQFSGSENYGSNGNSRSQFLNLTSGVNIGAWRLRDNSTWSYRESSYESHQRWQHLNSYVQRAIIPWRSELTLGDKSTGSEVFDAISFRGVQLTTDDNMYPDTMRGFAPVVRGTANSSAEISIRQNGSVVYRTHVAAGAFVIKDLYALSSAGDLDVMVTEADGSTRQFTVPYSSVPLLQREGHLRYGITAGRYRNSSNRYGDPVFAQGTLLWGLAHNITAYGGTQLASNYRALALGAGINMGRIGAISTDITQASSTLADGSQHDGQSVRFLYAHSLIATGTTFQLAGYRYSTQGFYTLDETALKGMSGWTTEADVDDSGRPVKRDWINYYNLHNNKRERLQANISQRLGSRTSLYLTGSRQTYWNNSATTSSLQAGFSSNIGKASYSLSYGYTRYSGQSGADKTLWFSLSMPLDVLSGQSDANSHPMWMSYSASQNSEGHIAQQTSLSGTALETNNLSWSAAQGYGRRDGNSGDLSLAYQGTYGNASAGYGYNRTNKQLRYSTSGSAVLHRDGLTLGQPLGETNVLVAIPGAAGVPVKNGTGVQTDWRGYAVVPYAAQYRENRIGLDVSQLDEHTDIDNAVSRVIPTQGALVRADFQAHQGARALITLTQNGKLLPFGTMVSADNGKASGLVDDSGQVYLSGLPLQGELMARWGQQPDQHCTASFTLPEKALKTALIQTAAICR